MSSKLFDYLPFTAIKDLAFLPEFFIEI